MSWLQTTQQPEDQCPLARRIVNLESVVVTKWTTSKKAGWRSRTRKSRSLVGSVAATFSVHLSVHICFRWHSLPYTVITRVLYAISQHRVDCLLTDMWLIYKILEEKKSYISWCQSHDWEKVIHVVSTLPLIFCSMPLLYLWTIHIRMKEILYWIISYLYFCSSNTDIRPTKDLFPRGCMWRIDFEQQWVHSYLLGCQKFGTCRYSHW